MATLHLASKKDIERSQRLTEMVKNGDFPIPPKSTQKKRNICDKCHGDSILRYHVPGVGYCCTSCWQDWRAAPRRCDTRASDVHRGCCHVALGIFDDDYTSEARMLIDKSLDSLDKQIAARTPIAPVARQNGAHATKAAKPTPSWVETQVAAIKTHRGAESLAAEARWHKQVTDGAARRGAVVCELRATP